MFSGLFGWLRNRTRAAVVAGVQDALDELSGVKVEDETPAPLRLTFKEPEPEKGKRKAV